MLVPSVVADHVFPGSDERMSTPGAGHVRLHLE